jgi:hypothetical protein
MEKDPGSGKNAKKNAKKREKEKRKKAARKESNLANEHLEESDPGPPLLRGDLEHAVEYAREHTMEQVREGKKEELAQGALDYEFTKNYLKESGAAASFEPMVFEPGWEREGEDLCDVLQDLGSKGLLEDEASRDALWQSWKEAQTDQKSKEEWRAKMNTEEKNGSAAKKETPTDQASMEKHSSSSRDIIAGTSRCTSSVSYCDD